MTLATWLYRLLTWDGILPVFVLALPSFIEWLLPNNRGAIEIAAVVLPIAAFLIRATVGRRHIAANQCSPVFRGRQYAAFYLGIFMFVLMDCVLILTHVMPRGAFGPGDYMIFAIFIGTYMFLMAVAMYPGRAQPLPEVFRPQSG